MNKLNKLVVEKDNHKQRIIRKYFGFQDLIDTQRELYKTKNAGKNKDLVNVIRSGLADLENKIEELSEDEIENERLYDIVSIVKDILYVNDQNQEEQGLKILTPGQMLRLPISLAQLKEGNNSEKFKNEIRQLIFFVLFKKN